MNESIQSPWNRRLAVPLAILAMVYMGMFAARHPESDHDSAGLSVAIVGAAVAAGLNNRAADFVWWLLAEIWPGLARFRWNDGLVR
jgi:hypothetical protein